MPDADALAHSEHLRQLLQEQIKTVSGKRFNATLIEETIDNMVQVLGDQGFAFVDVSPELRRDSEREHVADLVENPHRGSLPACPAARQWAGSIMSSSG